MNSSLELDIAYSPSSWVQRTCAGGVTATQEFIKICNEESDRFSTATGFDAHLDVPYGTEEREEIDIFTPKSVAKDAPVYIFIHGGYWRIPELSKNNNSFLAPPLIDRGAVVVIMSYAVAPEGNIPQMVKQTEEVVKLIAKRFPETRGIYISGHCAGGQMAVMMLNVDWTKCLDNGRNLIKGLIPISGVFDLRPLVKTYINKTLTLTESSAAAVSPTLWVNSIPDSNLDVKVILPFAEFDSPVFQKESKDYCKLLKARGIDASLVKIPGKDHFNEVSDMIHDWAAIQQINFTIMELTS